MQMVGCTLDKTLLVLGGGPDQIPGISKAKEMGIYTIVLDGNPNADAKKYANEFHTVSIKHFEQIEEFIKNKLTKKVDGVIAFGVDIASIIAKTADTLDVNYTIPLESAKLSEDKFISKVFMHKNSIPIPEYKQVENLEDIKSFIADVGFPVIIKPVDNSAARGISLIYSDEQLSLFFEHAQKLSPSKKVIIEQYLSGPQITTESIVYDNNIFNICCSDRNYNDIDKFLPNIIENGGDLPSIYMKEKHKNQLKNYLNIISKNLNIKNGIIKGDIVIHNDELYIIEFALRLSGGNFSGFQIQHHTGINFLLLCIHLHLGDNIDTNHMKQTTKNILSIRYKFPEDVNSGKIKNIQLPKKNNNILFSNFHVNVEDTISEKTTNHAERLGFAIATGNTREDAIKNAQKYLDNVEIICE